MLFTRNNPPLGYYVYLYLREDGTPYYVGKGINTRAWNTHRDIKNNKGVHTPKDNTRIVIIAHRLENAESFFLERKLIAKYGRKDLGTGILRNKTDGGEGISSSDMIRRWNKEDSPYRKTEYHSYVKGRQKKLWSDPNSTYNSEEYRKKLSDSIGKWKRSSEGRKQNSELRSIIVWVATDPDGVEYKFKNLNQFCRERGLNKTIMGNIANGHGKTHYGWGCRKDQTSTNS